ncbi:MAG: homeobox domain-containing protein [Polyangiaceae bacterium]
MDRSRRSEEFRDAIRLAGIPVGVAVVFAALLAPRSAIPCAVPIPIADAGNVAAAVTGDRVRAARARQHMLPGPSRALGTAIREFHLGEARSLDASAMADARMRVDVALVEVLGTPDAGREALLDLRAVQLDQFMSEVARLRATGKPSPELSELAGSFLPSMTADGWYGANSLVPDDDVLRVMFKDMWNTVVGLQRRQDLAPSLDEERLLYAFYLRHPHPSRPMREALAATRRSAADAGRGISLERAERAALEAWRIDRVGRLAALDPAYPADFARGIAQYSAGAFDASASSFRSWLRDHPDGPWTLRARNYLRAAEQAGP